MLPKIVVVMEPAGVNDNCVFKDYFAYPPGGSDFHMVLG